MNEIEELIKRHYSSHLNLKENEIDEYIIKLKSNATFISHIEHGSIVAFLAFYVNNTDYAFSYATMLIVEPNYRRNGIANELLKYWLKYAKNKGFQTARLEVNIDNPSSIKMCEKVGFKISNIKGQVYTLERLL